MAQRENIICFSSIDWDFIWQGHQQIMQNYAKQGHTVLFIENTGVRRPGVRDIHRIQSRIKNWMRGTHGVRQIQSRLYVYSPLLLPFPYSKLAFKINTFLFWRHLKRWLRSMQFHHPIVWSFLPTAITQKMIAKIDGKVNVYYCIDKFSVSSAAAKRISEDEQQMIKKSDIIFATSHHLVDYCKKNNPNVHFFPFGVDMKNFENRTYQKRPPKKPNDMADIKGPIIGYIGGLHKWVNVDLLHDVIQKNPKIQFVFIGPLQMDVSTLQALDNAHFLGKKKTEELPHYAYFFDLCMIPYRITSYTDCVYPTKLNEYLAMGKPVISTPLKEIQLFNEHHGNPVVIAESTQGFSEKIRDLVHSAPGPVPMDEALERITIARSNSWSERIRKMDTLIEQKIQQKALVKERNWSDRLKKIYKEYPKRLVAALALFLVLYIGTFHTAIPYFLAQPLKKETRLEKADVILALGGGVGETGLAGQGYQERVKTATDLYNKGLAKNIIFSSGYRYLFKEANVMRDLAVSLGVPKKHVYIENQARNTYENFKFSAEIIRKLNFKSVIIISSPYHMRRAGLVAKKQLPADVNVVLKSVDECAFFGSFKRRPKWEQLKALAFEVVSIFYYKTKDYL